jgi:hypothetical protein
MVAANAQPVPEGQWSAAAGGSTRVSSGAARAPVGRQTLAHGDLASPQARGLGPKARSLLQNSGGSNTSSSATFRDACNPLDFAAAAAAPEQPTGASSTTNAPALSAIAARLLGDTRLQLKAVRYLGACGAIGLAIPAPPSALAGLMPAAVVLSSGAAADAAAPSNGPKRSSTAYGTPAPVGSGFPAGSFDAAVLELEIAVAPGTPPHSQMSLAYLFGSEEFGLSGGASGGSSSKGKGRKADPLLLEVRPAGGGGCGGVAAAAAPAQLPGRGGQLAGAGLRPPEGSGVGFHANEPTQDGALPIGASVDGFTQVRRK